MYELTFGPSYYTLEYLQNVHEYIVFLFFVTYSKINPSKFQEGVAAAAATAISAEVQNDQHPSPVKDAYADDTDDDGSGLEPDESSGSGWGAGPGPDDEDGRGGSGDAPHELPEDDEDFVPRTTTPHDVLDYSEELDKDNSLDSDREDTVRQDTVQEPSTPEPSTEAPILRSRQFDVEVRE